MEQIPRLSDDVLYIISEKLLFKDRYVVIDLRSKSSFNPYTLFMYHSARNMRAVLSHFSKMKHLDLSTCDNDCLIKFYKDVIPEYIVRGCFYLPFWSNAISKFIPYLLGINFFL